MTKQRPNVLWICTDQNETHNLWDVSEAQGIKLAMYQRLCDRMAWTVDPLPEREGPW